MEGETLGCYGYYMDYFIIKKFGRDFKEKLHKKAKEIYSKQSKANEEAIKLLEANSTEENEDSNTVYKLTEIAPEFNYNNCKESIDCITMYIDNNKQKLKTKCEGKVFVQFVIERDGSLSNFNVIRGIENCIEYNEEAIRLIKTMPKWTPGKEKGKNVRTSFTIPVKFK